MPWDLFSNIQWIEINMTQNKYLIRNIIIWVFSLKFYKIKDKNQYYRGNCIEKIQLLLQYKLLLILIIVDSIKIKIKFLANMYFINNNQTKYLL